MGPNDNEALSALSALSDWVGVIQVPPTTLGASTAVAGRRLVTSHAHMTTLTVARIRLDRHTGGVPRLRGGVDDDEEEEEVGQLSPQSQDHS